MHLRGNARGRPCDTRLGTAAINLDAERYLLVARLTVTGEALTNSAEPCEEVPTPDRRE